MKQISFAEDVKNICGLLPLGSRVHICHNGRDFCGILKQLVIKEDMTIDAYSTFEGFEHALTLSSIEALTDCKCNKDY